MTPKEGATQELKSTCLEHLDLDEHSMKGWGVPYLETKAAGDIDQWNIR